MCDRLKENEFQNTKKLYLRVLIIRQSSPASLHDLHELPSPLRVRQPRGVVSSRLPPREPLKLGAESQFLQHPTAIVLRDVGHELPLGHCDPGIT